MLEDAGGLLPAEKTVEERVGEKERWRGGGGDVEMGMVGRGSEGGGGRF